MKNSFAHFFGSIVEKNTAIQFFKYDIADFKKYVLINNKDIFGLNITALFISKEVVYRLTHLLEGIIP